MLAGVLAYIALIALVAATILSAGVAMTRMTIERAIRPYFASGYQIAAAALQQTIAEQMRGDGVLNPRPTFTPITAACANAACTYKTTETIALTQVSAATPGPACDTAQTNCAPNVQTNAYVAESRLTALITVNVTDAQGNTIATRSGALVLRTLTSPPYVTIAGTRDGTFDDVVGANTAGDDGGAPPATPNPCASATPNTSDDTAVRVEYRNKSTNACTDAGAWADASYSVRGTSGGWNP